MTITETQMLLNDDNIRDRIAAHYKNVENHWTLIDAMGVYDGALLLKTILRDCWRFIQRHSTDLYNTRVYECMLDTPTGQPSAFVAVTVKTDVTDTAIIDITPHKPELQYTDA